MKTKGFIKIKFRILLIIIAIILCSIITIIISGSEQNIEQYYIEGSHYIKHEEDIELSYRPGGRVISNYAEYIDVFYKDSEVIALLQNVVNENFFKGKSLIVLEDSTDSAGGIDGHISKINIKNNIANITIKRDYKEYGCVAIETRTYFIPIDNKNITEVIGVYKFPFDILDVINPVLMLSPFIILGVALLKFVKIKKDIKKMPNNEIEKKMQLKKAVKRLIKWIAISGIWEFILESIYSISNNAVYKPIIYLYPTKPQQLSVKLGYRDKIIVSYPEYSGTWNVFAKPNGDIIDIDTNKNLYSLYYESDAICKFKVEKDGFVVKRDDIVNFLEDKLSILGLTYREMEEFIIYWLPVLQKNKYNYIRFASPEEINQNMPLEFSKQPNTLIRILMTYKGLKKPIDIEEQKLESPARVGFVAVEWGGTEIR